MHVLMVGSEVEPFAKTGGLADVLGALPRAVAALGHEVSVILPRYRGITAGTHVARVPVRAGEAVSECDIFATGAEGVRTYFVDRPEYFDRDGLYGTASGDHPDNPARFAYFAHAVVAWMQHEGRVADVVHTHDWQTGLVPLLLAGGDPRRPRAGTVFTIHNLAYQGTFDADWLPRIGLPPSLLRPDALEYWGRISYLKAGLTYSRVITTVSPRYAQEIQTPEYGFGFDGLLRARAADVVGILNGIDVEQWNPATDVHVPDHFDAESLERKALAKRRLLEACRIPVSDESLRRPLVGLVSRLVAQKGFDLVAGIAEEIPRLPATFVVLGTGEPVYEHMWRGLAAAHPDRIAARIGFDEALAHLVEAGADLFLMPSRFEPCGLNQMYSLRYGTVPLVRRTGGLADTVTNVDVAAGTGTGFTFDEYTPEALLGTLRWALEVFEQPDVWRRIQRAGMREDHSWLASARLYEAAYARACGAA